MFRSAPASEPTVSAFLRAEQEQSIHIRLDGLGRHLDWLLDGEVVGLSGRCWRKKITLDLHRRTFRASTVVPELASRQDYILLGTHHYLPARRHSRRDHSDAIEYFS